MKKDYTPECGLYHKCNSCGKNFFVPSWQEEKWHWKIKTKIFCSYTCMRKYESTHKRYRQVKDYRGE